MLFGKEMGETLMVVLITDRCDGYFWHPFSHPLISHYEDER